VLSSLNPHLHLPRNVPKLTGKFGIHPNPDEAGAAMLEMMQ
jgi:hypothetical protein